MCKECSVHFIEGDKRQKYGLADKLKVIKLYLENCGIRTIERLTGVRNSQVSTWIEEAANNIRSELQIAENSIKDVKDIAILELDELCTYIKQDQRMGENIPSYGLLFMDNQIKLLVHCEQWTN